LYAYSHHFKWWREVKLEEAEWQASLSRKSKLTAAVAASTDDAIHPRPSKL